jgi:folate-binding protein YgfZ
MIEFTYAPQHLPQRAVVAVGGEDAGHFLHNLVSCDVAGLASGQAAYGALLTPQGKILFDIFILRDGAGFLLDCAAAQQADLIKRLTFYKLRAKVNIAPRNDLAVAVSAQPLTGLAYPDPRVARLGWRGLVAAGTGASGTGYDEARLRIGLADSDGDIGSGILFPHEANFDQFGGVSFSKGCYVGQEVVSRMQHRGTARSRILPLTADAPVAPAKGTPIMRGEQVVGEVLSHHGPYALGLMRLDRLSDSSTPLLAGETSVRVQVPDWVHYTLTSTTEVT